MPPASKTKGRIRVGIGGWNFAPWRNNFYPAKWPQKRELEYASGRLTAIEVNSTYYRPQTAKTYASILADLMGMEKVGAGPYESALSADAITAPR